MRFCIFESISGFDWTRNQSRQLSKLGEVGRQASRQAGKQASKHSGMKAPSSSGMHTPHVNPVCAHDPNACKFVQKAALAERNKKTSQEERIYPAGRSHDGVQRGCSTRDPVSAGHVVIICLSARQSCLRRTTCWRNCREKGSASEPQERGSVLKG